MRPTKSFLFIQKDFCLQAGFKPTVAEGRLLSVHYSTTKPPRLDQIEGLALICFTFKLNIRDITSDLVVVYQNKCAVDGEWEVCDGVEHVEQEDKHHRQVDLVTLVQTDSFVRNT